MRCIVAGGADGDHVRRRVRLVHSPVFDMGECARASSSNRDWRTWRQRDQLEAAFSDGGILRCDSAMSGV